MERFLSVFFDCPKRDLCYFESCKTEKTNKKQKRHAVIQTNINKLAKKNSGSPFSFQYLWSSCWKVLSKGVSMF